MRPSQFWPAPMVLVALFSGCPSCTSTNTPDAGTSSSSSSGAASSSSQSGVSSSGGGSSSSAAMDAGLPVEEVPTAFIAAVCEAQIRCGNIPFGDQLLCQSLLQASMGGGSTFDTPQSLVDSVVGGRIQYSPGLGTACIQAYRDMACDTEIGPPSRMPGCEGTFVGTVGDGGRCISALACTTGLRCEHPSQGDAGPCEATCTPLPASCTSDEECAPGTYCRNGGTCGAMGAPGMLSGMCGERGRCVEDLVCAQNADGGTCVARASLGQVCGTSVAPTCALGLLCIPDGVSPGNHCAPNRGLMDSCASVFECGGTISRMMCNADAGVCGMRPSTGACVVTPDGTPLCNPVEAWCDVQADAGTATCRPYLAAGSGCVANRECGPEFGRVQCQQTPDGGRCEGPGAPVVCLP